MGLLHDRKATVNALPKRRHNPVHAGSHIGGSSLKNRELANGFGQFRHNLNRTGPRSDNGYPLARKINGVIPIGRVEHSTRKHLGAYQLRQTGAVERAGGHHHNPRCQHISSPVGELPDPLILQKLGTNNVGIIANVGPQTVLFDAVFEVSQNFGLGRKLPRPVGIGRKRKRV